MAEIAECLCLCAASTSGDMDCCRLIVPCCKNHKICCYNQRLYPALTLTKARICRVLNVIPIFAGWGTILSSCLAPFSRPLDRVKMVLFGLLYWVLMPVLCLGWCLSCRHGRRLKVKAKQMERAISRVSATADDLRKQKFNIQKKREGNENLELEDIPFPDEEAVDIFMSQVLDENSVSKYHTKHLKEERDAIVSYMAQKRLKQQ